MTKLDDIEASMGTELEMLTVAEWAEKYGPLLIRAVRQLGVTVNVYLDIQESEGDLRTLPYQVDPDVLEFLKE